MKKDYKKPLIKINEINEKEDILALEVSSTNPLAWVKGNDTESGYKEFEW